MLHMLALTPSHVPPTQLVIVDESQRHAGHAAMRSASPGKAGGSGETHFVVEVVSDSFEYAPTVKRHSRTIYQVGSS